MTDTLTTLFALLTLVCAGATLFAIVVLVASRRAAPGSALEGLRLALGDLSLWMAWLVAAVTMAGSLYYSIGAHYLPCELCWYQRICIYPLAVILLVGALRRDRRVWWYAGIPAVVGLVIAAYHTQLQAFPEQKSFCETTNPCTNRFVWEFGFISLPLMALVAFVFIITMLVVSATTVPRVDELDIDPTDESPYSEEIAPQ